MSREIKFSGICIENTSEKGTIKYGWLQEYKGKYFIHEKSKDGDSYYYVPFCVDKDSVCQFSGLVDKFETDIYEKDRVRMFGIINTVFFINGAFGYYTDEKNKVDFISFSQNQHFEIEENQSKLIEVLI